MAVISTKYKLFAVDEGNTQDVGALGKMPIGVGAPLLSPTSPVIDVAHDFSWTLSPKEAREDVPVIRLREYRLNQSNMINAVKYWFDVVKQSVTEETTSLNPYKALYPGTETKFNYLLPYFSPHNRTIGNSWSDSTIDLSVPYISDQGSWGKLFDLKSWEAGAKLLATGVGHEVPKVYSGGSLENITVSFVLLNTTTPEDLQRNWEFCYLLAYQNLQNRHNAILVAPPVFYEMEIPGIKYGYSVISNLQITHLGQTKILELDREKNPAFLSGALGYMKNIPEAYGVSITLSDLIPQSRNFMEAMRSESYRSLVTATEDPKNKP